MLNLLLSVFQVFFRLKNTRAVIAIYQIESSCLDIGCNPSYCNPSKEDFPKEKQNIRIHDPRTCGIS